MHGLRKGTVSTNGFLHAAHNFCVKTGWLPWPIVPPGQWPARKFKPRRAITIEEHNQIIEHEHNPELRAFYEMLWFTGGAQSDIAKLQAEDIDWPQRTVAYLRVKTGTRCVPNFGDKLQNLLQSLPKAGPLFPRMSVIDAKHRAKEFRRCCLGLGIDGISLHSYRYAWAERARIAGYLNPKSLRSSRATPPSTEAIP